VLCAVASDAASQPISSKNRAVAKKYFMARGIRCDSLAKSQKEENSF
jgi:hypothetical protein